MDEQQNINLDFARSLGRIEAGIESIQSVQAHFIEQLDKHTEQDATQFGELKSGLSRLDQLSWRAFRWGVAAAGTLAALAAAAQQVFGG